MSERNAGGDVGDVHVSSSEMQNHKMTRGRVAGVAFAFCALVLWLVGCSNVPSQPHLSEVELRKSIVGEWTRDFGAESSADTNSPGKISQMILAPDGTITRVRVDGTRKVLGNWTLKGNILDVNTFTTNYSTVGEQKVSTGTHVLLPIISDDEHELICAPGVNKSGRMRFTK